MVFSLPRQSAEDIRGITAGLDAMTASLRAGRLSGEDQSSLVDLEARNAAAEVKAVIKRASLKKSQELQVSYMTNIFQL